MFQTAQLNVRWFDLPNKFTTVITWFTPWVQEENKSLIRQSEEVDGAGTAFEWG